jgi:ATP-dependent Clp protease ATP-binding subunit ClpC
MSTIHNRQWPQLQHKQATASFDPNKRWYARNPLLVHIYTIIRYILALVSCLVSISLLATIISLAEVVTLESILWTQGPLHTALGLSILASCLCIVWAWYRDEVASIANLHTQLATGASVSLESFLPEESRRVLEYAAACASSEGVLEIQPSHLLAALANSPRIIGIISRGEVQSSELITRLFELINYTPSYQYRGYCYLSAEAADILTTAMQSVVSHGYPALQLEDIFLSWLDTKPEITAVLQKELLFSRQLLVKLIDWYARDEAIHIRHSLWRHKASLRPVSHMNRAWTARPTPLLNSVGDDLTIAAHYGQLRTTEVRGDEIATVMRYLDGSEKPSVLLVGEMDTHPEILIHTLALRIAAGDVPQTLRDTRLVSVDLSRILTATDDPEGTIAGILEEVQDAGNVVLVIPNIQQLISVGSTHDSATVLANAIERRALTVITTASYPDYHRYVEQNMGLQSLLRVVELHQLTEDETYSAALEAIPRLESMHHVSITLPAIEVAVRVSNEHLRDHAQPGAVERVLEEACVQAAAVNNRWVLRSTIAKALESITQIPTGALTTQEAQYLLTIEEQLGRAVLGQEYAIAKVADAVRRARTGLTNPKRPRSSFLFVGPTGVGKTELAKALATHYFGAKSRTIRLDMSEYQDARSIYTLIGAPADTSGSPLEGGVLTQAVSEHPHSLILLDEFEKAHPDVRNLLLQILEDGIVTENTGRVISFTSCILIATSNAEVARISETLLTVSDANEVDKAIMRILESSFPPELINRFDAIVPFKPLNQETLVAIGTKLVAEVAARIAQQQVQILVPSETLVLLVQQGTDTRYGARPLRRVIEQKLEAAVAKLLLSGTVTAGDTITITPAMIQ